MPSLVPTVFFQPVASISRTDRLFVFGLLKPELQYRKSTVPVSYQSLQSYILDDARGKKTTEEKILFLMSNGLAEILALCYFLGITLSPTKIFIKDRKTVCVLFDDTTSTFESTINEEELTHFSFLKIKALQYLPNECDQSALDWKRLKNTPIIAEKVYSLFLYLILQPMTDLLPENKDLAVESNCYLKINQSKLKNETLSSEKFIAWFEKLPVHEIEKIINELTAKNKQTKRAEIEFKLRNMHKDIAERKMEQALSCVLIIADRYADEITSIETNLALYTIFMGLFDVLYESSKDFFKNINEPDQNPSAIIIFVKKIKNIIQGLQLLSLYSDTIISDKITLFFSLISSICGLTLNNFAKLCRISLYEQDEFDMVEDASADLSISMSEFSAIELASELVLWLQAEDQADSTKLKNKRAVLALLRRTCQKAEEANQSYAGLVTASISSLFSASSSSRLSLKSSFCLEGFSLFGDEIEKCKTGDQLCAVILKIEASSQGNAKAQTLCSKFLSALLLQVMREKTAKHYIILMQENPNFYQKLQSGLKIPRRCPNLDNAIILFIEKIHAIGMAAPVFLLSTTASLQSSLSDELRENSFNDLDSLDGVEHFTLDENGKPLYSAPASPH